MKTFLYFSIILCSFFSVNAQTVSFNKVGDYQISIPPTHYTGDFNRMAFHTSNNLYYFTFGATKLDSACNIPNNKDYVWVEYDTNITSTGNYGILPSFNKASDYAIVHVNNYYFHLTGGGPQTYSLKKFDENFVLIDSVDITTLPDDRLNDQMLNFTNGLLVFGANNETNATTHYCKPHIFEYDTNLNYIHDTLLNLPFVTVEGGGIIYNQGKYNVLAENKPFRTFIYRFDNNWSFQDSILLDTNTCWTQNIIWTNGVYVIPGIYSTEHNAKKDLVLFFMDQNWQIIDTARVTNYYSSALDSTEVNRAWVYTFDNKLFVTYDTKTIFGSNCDYTPRLAVYEYSVNTGISNIDNSNIKLTPNPVHSLLIIKNSSDIESIDIFDVSGKIIKSNKLPKGVKSTSIDVANLQTGIYFIKLKTENQLKIAKFIKE